MVCQNKVYDWQADPGSSYTHCFPPGQLCFWKERPENWRDVATSGWRFPFLKARDISLDLCSMWEKSELQDIKFFPLGLAGFKYVEFFLYDSLSLSWEYPYCNWGTMIQLWLVQAVGSVKGCVI